VSVAAVAVIGVLVSGALAIIGVEARVRVLTLAFKPLATLLLFAVMGWPHGFYAWCIAIGFVFSLAGDVALLSPSNRAFIIGLAAFLLGHVAYVVAFISVDIAPGWRLYGAIVIVGTATVSVLRMILPGAAGMKVPVLIYATVITAMVVTAWCTIGGPLPRATYAAVGATLFYLSDMSLSLDRFWKPIPHGALLTMGVYWLGQLGIAWSAAPGD
jgi:alkenylglycerophosphocholine/alkenylglycerophosphoethanolamine hydrolase